ncbi:putative Ser/Thr protein kinase [Lipingzhangella halophila]|uniref:Putative Ser/Thr protein kinase n=1 Tax=Lipingzhangella halophila TaxID=1783352 RepID=A0A7W7RKG0_9ACTN|nr:serine/threonine-protein kinase [Lipingzhangella halophila]MBB4933663.1 putative Ser/Thr protein kinase [Lipingzhangella halophila]
MPESAPLTDDDPAEIGGYRLLGRLGAGGQGTVYLAEPAQGGDRVAVKSLSAEALDDSRVRQRFVREAEAARQVASFCTAAVLAADFDAESPYIVSEYVEGRSLSQRIRQDGPMAAGDLGRLAVATATALVAIHEAGIVHRDFKPGNVLFGDGGARVIDFGIAQITEGAGTLTNSTIGTPAFMAPEQIAHGNATPASDMFAWGAVMAFAATGASPFDGGTVPNVLHNVLHTDPDLRALPDELRPLVAAALAKDPAVRPAAVDVLMTLLGRQGRPTDAAGLNQAMHEARTAVLDDTGASTVANGPPTGTMTPATDASDPRRQGKRPPRWLLGAGAVVAVIALLGAGALLSSVLRPGGTPNGAESPGTRDGAESPGTQDGAESPGGNGRENPASEEDTDDPSSDRSEDAASADYRFSEEEAGAWEGVADSGNVFEVHIEAGAQTAALEALDNDTCSAEIRLLESTEDGYRANIPLSGGLEPNRCVDNTEFWPIIDEAELTVDGDTMTIGFFEEDEESEPRSTLELSRTG